MVVLKYLFIKVIAPVVDLRENKETSINYMPLSSIVYQKLEHLYILIILFAIAVISAIIVTIDSSMTLNMI